MLKMYRIRDDPRRGVQGRFPHSVGKCREAAKGDGSSEAEPPARGVGTASPPKEKAPCQIDREPYSYRE